MKIQFLMATALAAVLGLSSCGKDAKLADDLAGTWKSAPTAMMPDDDDHHGRETGEMLCTPTFTFERTDIKNGGTINISADYTVTKNVTATATPVPVKATASGTISATGTWRVEDGDEVKLAIDASKTVVNVDTSTVTLSYAQVTDASVDSLAAMKPNVASAIADILTPMLTAKVNRLHEFDDVKITGDNLTLEVADNRLTLTRQK